MAARSYAGCHTRARVPPRHRGPLPCTSLLPSQKREGSRHLSSPSENGMGGGVCPPPENRRGGVLPLSQAHVVPEHTVWGSLIGSARKAHCGRASVGVQGARSAHRRSWALAGGVRILAPMCCHIKTGPGREVSGGRLEVFFHWGGHPRGSAPAVADGSHAFGRVAVHSLTYQGACHSLTMAVPALLP